MAAQVRKDSLEALYKCMTRGSRYRVNTQTRFGSPHKLVNMNPTLTGAAAEREANLVFWGTLASITACFAGYSIITPIELPKTFTMEHRKWEHEFRVKNKLDPISKNGWAGPAY